MKKDYALNDDSIVIGTSVKTGKIQLGAVLLVSIALLVLAILLWCQVLPAGDNAIGIGLALALLALGAFVIDAFGFFRMEGVEGETITISKDSLSVVQKKAKRAFPKDGIADLSFKHANKLTSTSSLLIEFKDGKSLYFGFLAIPQEELGPVKEKAQALWANPTPKESA
jgi:hypothetical protein